MDSVRISLLFLFLYGFACVESNNPITSWFSKSQEEKSEAEDKAGATTTTSTTIKPAGDGVTTTTTANPNTMCGGLKGFLHMCEKTEPTEPPKNVKTRSAPEEDSDSSSDEDDDDDDDDDDNDNDEESEETKPDTDKNEKEVEEGEGATKEPAKAEIEKREATATAGPPPGGDPYVPLGIDVEAVVAKRAAEDSSSEEESSEEDVAGRGRRECRDRDGEGKDCKKRRKREFVPDLVPLKVRKTNTAKKNESSED